MKTCKDCGETKPLEDFHWLRKDRGTRHSYCKDCCSGRNRAWRAANPERNRELGRKEQADAYTREKIRLIDEYGGKCTCCGEAEIHFLTIEHKHGLPDHHKLPSGKRLSGLALLRRIKKEGYPDDYTVNCMNCNYAKGHYGFCPHQPHSQEERRYP